jgi:hypothetical protein
MSEVFRLGWSGEAGRNLSTQWAVWRDLVVALLPHLDFDGLYYLVCELRVQTDDAGRRGAWAPLSGVLDAQRVYLLGEVVKAAERLTGKPWPILDDQLIPDDPSGLV